MTITRDVIQDLMPLYLAGEASADTRRLIDEYLQANPNERPPADALALPPSQRAPDVESQTLTRTREVYRRQSTALAGALALSYAVFSFRFDSHGLSFVLFRDLPSAASALLAAAAGVWVHFLLMHRRWIATGLASSSSGSSGLWLAGGALAMLPYAFVASHQFGFDDVRALCVVGAFTGLAIGQALHRWPEKP
jgi:hypothetical protein